MPGVPSGAVAVVADDTSDEIGAAAASHSTELGCEFELGDFRDQNQRVTLMVQDSC